MTISNGYISLANYKLYADISSTDTNDDTVIELLIEAACRHFDAQTGRTFYARSETRYYNVPIGRKLWLDDDLLAITTLTNGDGNAIAATEYNLEPKNYAPHYAIMLKQSSSTFWEADSDGNSERVISVAGTWGYASIAPKDVEQAIYEMTKAAYNRRSGENQEGTARLTPAGVVITPNDVPAFARAVMRRYARMN